MSSADAAPPGRAKPRVLLVGNGGTQHVGAFFRRALVELGIPHAFVDEAAASAPRSGSLPDRAWYRLAGRTIGRARLNRRLVRTAAEFAPDVVLVTKGAYVEPSALDEVRATSGPVMLNFATDDPFNPVNSTPQLLASIPRYDVYVSTKRAVMADLRAAGARRVEFLPFGYEPSLHFREEPRDAAEASRWASDVVFIGGADADRFPLLRRIADLPGVALRLYGGYWGRDEVLRRAWRGFAVGRDYRLAIGGTRVAPCLVRRANRDGHVMRTFELPACGAFMLAERTAEHLELFDEGVEIACFESADELVDKVRYYLAHDDERRRIAAAGHRRVVAGGHTYRDRLQQLLRLAAG